MPSRAGRAGADAVSAAFGTSSRFARTANRVWNATVAMGCNSSRKWVQPCVPPTRSAAALRKPRPTRSPASRAKLSAAAGQTA